MSKRILAIDYGKRRVGIAVSDPTGTIASGVTTIDRKKIRSSLEHRIVELTTNYGAEEILVGLPVNMDGSNGERVEEVSDFIEKLKRLTELPITVWDERLTTVRASAILSELGVKENRKKGHLDRKSAELILQSYLNNKKEVHF